MSRDPSSSPAEPSTLPLPSLWQRLLARPFPLVVGTALLLATNVFDKAIPWLLQHAIDSLRAIDLEALRRYATLVVVVAVAMAIVRTLSRIMLFNIGRDIEFDLRNELLERLHRLGPSFFRKMQTGDIMSRATNDLGQVRLLVGFGLLNVVNSVFAYAGALALMLTISPKLTLYALIPYPLFVAVTRWFATGVFKRSRESQAALGALSERVQENLSGVRIVRAFAIETFEQERFERANEAALEKNMSLAFLRGVMQPVLSAFSLLGVLVVMWAGGNMVLRHELSVGQFVAFMAYLGQLVWPTLALGWILSIIQRGRASYARVREILTARPDVVEAWNAKPAGRGGALSVRGLTFAHEGRKVLDDVSFDVAMGDKVAVVGPTGSGKSTLAALLPRLLPTPEGTVFLDGDDVCDVKLSELRRVVAYAQQEPFLFSTTVARNIAFAADDPDAPGMADEVRRVAKEAAILDEVDGLPDGFETIVGERGVQLSGGQKQRVALARALLRQPRVLVLDDPLSAVDARTESLILSALDRASEGRTLVLVTHRIAAAQRATSIVVLDGGKVVERGTHDELLRNGGLYARLAARQRIEEELAAL